MLEVSLGVDTNHSDFLLVTDGSGTSENPTAQPRLLVSGVDGGQQLRASPLQLCKWAV